VKDINLKIQVVELAQSQAWWFIAVISALRKQRQEDSEFEATLRYIVSSEPF
jgi:hypothetical protein